MFAVEMRRISLLNEEMNCGGSRARFYSTAVRFWNPHTVLYPRVVVARAPRVMQVEFPRFQRTFGDDLFWRGEVAGTPAVTCHPRGPIAHLDGHYMDAF